jgi:hypothetical protein
MAGADLGEGHQCGRTLRVRFPKEVRQERSSALTNELSLGATGPGVRGGEADTNETLMQRLNLKRLQYQRSNAYSTAGHGPINGRDARESGLWLKA